ncbi:MAG: tRNA (N6-threonylcarbamoyladenosine(37)-N6)-methyltransferase TrmO [Pseudomonadota bacterium]
MAKQTTIEKTLKPITIVPVGIISTPFKQKFGIPRQPNLAKDAEGQIRFTDTIDVQEACRGIEEFSHLWLVFHFHQHQDRSIAMKVRPPRLGGKQQMGVFASRSSFRPSQLGMSVVKNLGIENGVLKVSGVDLLDGSPIVDIKPYIAYADVINDAQCGYAHSKPTSEIEVLFDNTVLDKLSMFDVTPSLIQQVLSQDPRSAHEKSKNNKKEYKMRLGNADIHWVFTNASQIRVFDIKMG